MNIPRFFVVGGTFAVIVAILAGLVLWGSPGDQREMGFYRERVQSLMLIAGTIKYSWQRVEKLPVDLTELVDGQRLQFMPVDPQTGHPYTYKKLDENSYRLCATFTLPSLDLTPTDFWSHQSGHKCYDFKLEKET